MMFARFREARARDKKLKEEALADARAAGYEEDYEEGYAKGKAENVQLMTRRNLQKRLQNSAIT